MLVQVAIDLALDRLFTYEVPEALQKKLTVGQLLSVPFGHREARGFSMALSEEGAVRADYALRPVTAIVDETPFFSPALLDLVKRVAAYTASPIESVLKAALPAVVLKRDARAKERLFVSVPPSASSSSARPSGLSKRQQWLYENIVRLDGGWLSWLCQELKTTPATLRLLADKGLVAIAERVQRRDPLAGSRILPTKPLPLNGEQSAALEAIDASADNSPTPVLLYGVTGSGKTEVYLQAIARVLARGKGAIVMVPEIALTPQTVRRFASRFGNRVAVLHSALSNGERYDEWHRIRTGEARVVVGPRSAVWAPVRDLALIVVDEEHEPSYKQGEMPRYHARDVAVLRGVLERARVVLGSATPSLESWANAKKGKYALVELRQRAGAGTMPCVRLVEMSGGAIFSGEMLDALRLCFDRGEQAILFLNRRGYSRSLTCASCGHAVECPECGVPYTYHLADSCLRCHVCGNWIPVPSVCPGCGCPGFDRKGIGTQRVEESLAKCFPKARILRMDADTVSHKNSHDEILSAFRRGAADVLLGTQMIAKGLDFPNVTFVGVLNADASLNIPDPRAAERTYQLLAQVAGRAGRAELAGEVLIQTHDVSSPVLAAVVRNDFAAFAEGEINVRRECFFPPFCHLAVLGLRSKDLRQVGDWAVMYAASLRNYFSAADAHAAQVSEAIPCAQAKADGWYRWQIVLRAVSPALIVRAWRWIVAARPMPSSVLASLDMDALDLL